MREGGKERAPRPHRFCLHLPAPAGTGLFRQHRGPCWASGGRVLATELLLEAPYVAPLFPQGGARHETGPIRMTCRVPTPGP